MAEEQNTFKIGDWVTVLDNIPERISNFHNGSKTFKIGYVSSDFVCETSRDEGNGIFLGAFRLATEDEIPGFKPKIEEEQQEFETIEEEYQYNLQKLKGIIDSINL